MPAEESITSPQPSPGRRGGTAALIEPPTAASFLRVAGLPVVRRVALSALRAGCAPVWALAGTDGDRLRTLLAGDSRTHTVIVVDAPPEAARSARRLPSDCVVTADDERVPIRAPRDVAVAERALIAALRRATADTDGPIARFDRALSTRLSLWLTRTPLRPNHITTLGTAIGLFGAYALAHGTHGWAVLGALLFCVAVIVDGCDGELARLTFRESRFGGLYDVVTDNVVHVAIFLGIGVGLHRAAPDWNYLRVLGVLLGGFACALIATVVCLLRHPPVRHLRPRTRKGRLRQGLLRAFEALMNRDFAYVVLVFAAADRLAWFLWATAAGTYVYAAGLVCVYRWRKAE
jgi:phosphatidylglycerophosphate synthase